MGSGGAYDVSISYAHSDGGAAGELNGWLCAQGFSTFFDRGALRPGLRWVPALEEGDRPLQGRGDPHRQARDRQYPAI